MGSLAMHTLHLRDTPSATGIDAQRRAFLPNMRRQSAEVRAAHACMLALCAMSPARLPPAATHPRRVLQVGLAAIVSLLVATCLLSTADAGAFPCAMHATVAPPRLRRNRVSTRHAPSASEPHHRF